MSLNLKSEETHRLVRELAILTGASMSQVVADAVKEKLARARKQQGRGMAERIMAIADETGLLFKEPFRSIEHGDLLYDENGLPK